MAQSSKAAQFRQLHANGPLVLPNAWDAASARIIEGAGASAIATTSSGMSWVHGRSDGQHLSRDELIESVRNIIRSVTVPVTVDIEGGYGTGSPEDVAQTVQGVLGAGAVGINLEDSPGRDGEPLLDLNRQNERIRAARQAAEAEEIDLFINARTDVYLRSVGDPQSRLHEVIRRAQAYGEAGADCIFVPGIVDAKTISAIVEAIRIPVNIMVGPDSPSISELSDLGVARVSIGSALARAALRCTLEATRELLGTGSYGGLRHALPFADVNGMFANG